MSNGRDYAASARRTEEILREAKAKAASLLHKKEPPNLSALERAYLTRLRELVYSDRWTPMNPPRKRG